MNIQRQACGNPNIGLRLAMGFPLRQAHNAPQNLRLDFVSSSFDTRFDKGFRPPHPPPPRKKRDMPVRVCLKLGTPFRCLGCFRFLLHAIWVWVKHRCPQWNLVSGSMDQNLRPPGVMLTHAHPKRGNRTARNAASPAEAELRKAKPEGLSQQDVVLTLETIPCKPTDKMAPSTTESGLQPRPRGGPWPNNTMQKGGGGSNARVPVGVLKSLSQAGARQNCGDPRNEGGVPFASL